MSKEKKHSAIHDGKTVIESKIWKAEMEGDYIIGKNHVFETEGKYGEHFTIVVDNEVITLPANTTLNSKLKAVPINAKEVVIEYIGDVKGDKFTYKNFIVSYDLPESTDPIFM